MRRNVRRGGGNSPILKIILNKNGEMREEIRIERKIEKK